MNGEADLQPFPFVVGRGRSGTTLLRAMLDAHPAMCLPGESHFVVQFATRRERYEVAGRLNERAFLGDLFEHWAFRRWGLAEAQVRAAFDAVRPHDLASAFRVVYGSYAASRGKTRYGDKTPSYVLHIEALAELFPEAVFVHLIRDGRDVALSYLDTDFGVRTLGQAAIHWDRFVRAGRQAGGALGPARYLEIRYEDLVRDPEPVLRDVCRLAHLPFADVMLRYYERAGELLPTMSHLEHHRNIHRPPTSGLRDWRRELPPADVAVFERLAGELLDELGYPRGASASGARSAVAAARFRVGTEVRRVGHGARVRLRKSRKWLLRRVVRGSAVLPATHRPASGGAP